MTHIEADELRSLSEADPRSVFERLESAETGLSAAEALARRSRYGPNAVGGERAGGALRELAGQALTPLNGLLAVLATASFFLGDPRAAAVIALIVALATLAAFVQEHRSSRAAAALRAMVKTSASVRRLGEASVDADGFREIPLEDVVPGDVVRLSAGDMLPGDLRVLSAKDLFVNQAALSGESMPVEKFAHGPARPSGGADPFELPNLGLMGTNVVSGFGTGVVLRTGAQTYFGRIAASLAGRRETTSFERGVSGFTWLMIRFMFVMVPAVFVINGVTKHDWLEALLFAVAIAVGLTPEMLPMIVTVNLAKGAIDMSRKRVIVKRLEAIQNFGAMDVLCTDKTGTLTQDRIILRQHLDIHGKESERVLEFAYLNSRFQSGLKNLLDVAVLEHGAADAGRALDAQYREIDEIPFDFVRRRMSVVVARGERHLLICKGAVDEIFAVCARYEAGAESGDLGAEQAREAREQVRALNEDGFRVVAVAYREIDLPRPHYGVDDERGLTLLGYVAFLDPPKESAGPAIRALGAAGVQVKILTGDNDVITRKICRDVGFDAGRIALGAEIDALGEAELAELADSTRVFARLAPQQKERVIAALRRRGRVVGFLGDGINDAAALKAADVGVSVDSAVDIAKESADIILLGKSLRVLASGVHEGRRVFANILKYIRMGASSNFGNMLSVLGASLFLPFLPMTAIQVLTNNLLYDFSQIAIPTDRVDAEYLRRPRRWEIGHIAAFMLRIGPVSSLFDYATFALMWFGFHAAGRPALFQTGWFVESLVTQTLIIHVIRTPKLPFVRSRASPMLIATTLAVAATAVILPFTRLGAAIGLVPLPPAYFPALAALMAVYAVSAQLAKRRFVRRYGF